MGQHTCQASYVPAIWSRNLHPSFFWSTFMGHPKTLKSDSDQGGHWPVNSSNGELGLSLWTEQLCKVTLWGIANGHISSKTTCSHRAMACRSMVLACCVIEPMNRSAIPFCQCVPTAQNVRRCWLRWQASWNEQALYTPLSAGMLFKRTWKREAKSSNSSFDWASSSAFLLS